VVQNLLSSILPYKNKKIMIYRTIILPVVLYGCETWSLTMGEEHRLRVFENRVLRRLFGPKRDEEGGRGPPRAVAPLEREEGRGIRGMEKTTK
jgi:hypothetical protein